MERRTNEAYRAAWHKINASERGQDVLKALGDSDLLIIDAYIRAQMVLDEAQANLREVDITNDPYEFLKRNAEVERVKKELREFEDARLNSKPSLSKVIDQYKSRLTRDPAGSVVEITRDYIQARRQDQPEERLKYPAQGYYIWRTQSDDHVRDEHAAREGKVFSFSKPPQGGHPGQFYNCRCWAEYLPDYWGGGLEKIFQR